MNTTYQFPSIRSSQGIKVVQSPNSITKTLNSFHILSLKDYERNNVPVLNKPNKLSFTSRKFSQSPDNHLSSKGY